MSINLLQTLQNAYDTTHRLSDTEKQVIKAMMQNNPKSFHDIDDTINEIMLDGKIDIHDIPKIVLLISQIFQQNFRIKNINMANIVKYICHVILESVTLSKENVTLSETLVDTSIDLLNININLIESSIKGCCGVSRSS
jgi:hypothetical protein